MFKFFLIILILPLIALASAPAGGTPITVLGRTAPEIYNIFLTIGGVIALIVLIFGGVYLGFSLGDPDAIKEAKKWIFSSLLGLIILFGSWSLLEILDPQFVVFGPVIGPPPVDIDIPAPEPIPEPEFLDGIIFHTHITPVMPNEEENQDLQEQEIKIARGAFREENLERVWWGGELQSFDIHRVEFRNPKDANGAPIQQYGVIAFEKPGFRGKCEIITTDSNITAKSIRTFVMPGASHHRPGDKLIFFETPYPFRFGPKPKFLDEAKYEKIKTNLLNKGYLMNVDNIPNTILKGGHLDRSNLLQEILSEKRKPIHVASPTPEQGIRVEAPLYMRIETGDVGRYLIILSDVNQNCYLVQENIIDLEDINRKCPEMTKRPTWIQTFQVLKIY